jgi:hypothetical protein
MTCSDSRQLMASQDVRDVYEILRSSQSRESDNETNPSRQPFCPRVCIRKYGEFPALTRRLSEGSKLEPGALSVPETSFS